MEETYKTYLFDAEHVFYKSGNFIIRHHFLKNYVIKVLSISSNTFSKSILKMRTWGLVLLSVSFHFLSGYLNGVVYQTRPTTLPSSRLRLKNTSPTSRRTHCDLLCKIVRIDLLNVFDEMDRQQTPH